MDPPHTIITCSNYRKEFEALWPLLNGHEAQFAYYSMQCGKKKPDVAELEALKKKAEENRNTYTLLGCACTEASGSEKTECGKSPGNCLELFLDKGVIDYFTSQKEFIITSGWLKNWKQIVTDKWGFTQETAREFFAGFAEKTRLINTQVWGGLEKEKAELEQFTGLPTIETKVSLDRLRDRVSNIVLEKALNHAHQREEELELKVNQAAADFNFVLDVLSQITETRGRDQTISLIMDIFMTLFAPRQIVYIYPDGHKLSHMSYPPGQVDVREYTKLMPLKGPVMQRGADSFAVNISDEDKNAGVLFVNQVTFPENIDQYQNLALVLASLSISVINNAEYISELNSIREKLNNSRKNLATIIESMREGVISANEEGIIITANSFAHQMLGRSNRSLLGADIDHVLTFYREQDNSRVDISLKEMANQSMAMDLAGVDYYLEKEGQKTYVRAQISPFAQEVSSGKGIIVLISDVSADVEANRELIKSENNLRALYDNSDESIVLLDTGARVVMANKKAQEISRFVSGKPLMMGSLIIDYVKKEDQANFRKNFERALKGQKLSFEVETELELGQQGKGWYLFNYTPVKDEAGNVSRIYYSQRDITRQKRTEILERNIEIAEKSARVKQRFMANMSHEIRTPMTGVIGMTDMLLKTKLDNQQHGYAKLIQEASEGLLNLLNDILDLSKIESGTISLHPELFSPESTVQRVVELYRHSAGQKGLELKCQVENPGERLLMADKNRYRQVLTNLLTNAIKYTEKGHVLVEAKVVSQGRGISKLHTRVVDTGIGITAEDQSKIFNAFTQVDSSISRTYDGAGLGLAICKELVVLMGGKIELESTLGKGSTFSFSINVQVTDHKPEQLEMKDAQAIAIPAGTKVLLAEDKLANQKVISLMLKNMGCQVVLANDGKEALDMYNEQEFDLVLLDIHMPVMDGLSSFVAMKALGKADIPFIAFSADADQSFIKKLYKAGFSDYLTKPVVYDKLKKLISKHLSIV